MKRMLSMFGAGLVAASILGTCAVAEDKTPRMDQMPMSDKSEDHAMPGHGKGKMMDGKGRMEHHKLMKETLEMMKDTMAIVRDLKHEPSADQRKRLDAMMTKIDDIIKRHEEMMKRHMDMMDKKAD